MRNESGLRKGRGENDMTYSITRRVDTQAGLYTAVVCAVPKDQGSLAIIRTHDCDSQNGAASLLDALAQALESELALRGDVVIAVEAQ